MPDHICEMTVYDHAQETGVPTGGRPHGAPAAYRVTCVIPGFVGYADWTNFCCLDCRERMERALLRQSAVSLQFAPLLDTAEGQLAHVHDTLREAITDLVSDAEPGQPVADRGLAHLDAFLRSLAALGRHLLDHARVAEAVHGAEVFVDVREPGEGTALAAPSARED